MDKDTQNVSLSLRKLPLSLRFIIKSFAFMAHHNHMHPPSISNDFSGLFDSIKSSGSYIGLIVYIGSYIGLFLLFARVTGLIFAETVNYFNREGYKPSSLLRYIRFGLEEEEAKENEKVH